VTVLSLFFGGGALVSLVAAASLLVTGSPLEPMWRLNPVAREGFAGLGAWAAVLLGLVSLATGATSVGLWRLHRWGWALAVGLLTVNVLADAARALSGADPRAAVGVPIAGALVLYLLLPRVRRPFRLDAASSGAQAPRTPPR